MAEVQKFTMAVENLPVSLCASKHTDMNTITLHNQGDIFENMPAFIIILDAEYASRNYEATK
jgi:hypothetical protein